MSCCSGSFKCPEACSLWNEVNRKYEEFWLNKSTWEDYEKARRAYYEHD